MTNERSDLPLGRLPRLTNPQHYQGLYIIDFGDGVSVGYLPAEVSALIECNQFPQMRIYRIHRAMPDGSLDLVSVSARTFQLSREESMLFLRQQEQCAREDFETLKTQAQSHFPCRARLQLAELPHDDYPFATLLTYPSAYAEEVSCWLLTANYTGGDTVEFTSTRSPAHQPSPEILEETTLEPPPTQTPRPLTELLNTRQYAVQR